MPPSHLRRSTRRRFANLRALAVAALTALFIAAPGPVAAADIDLLDLQAAVAAAQEVDPTLDPPPTDGTRDFVVGGFQSGDSNNGLSAHSGPAGEDPWGHVSRTVPENPEVVQERWRVTCVNVQGNLALVGAVPMQTGSSSPLPFLFMLRDSGPGGGTALNPDGSRSISVPPDECLNPTWFFFAATAPPIEHGNILVHDAQP